MNALTSPDPSPALVIHSTMPAWGVGLVVDDQPKRRSVQFQDGQTRTFRIGFYHLLEPWMAPSPSRGEAVARNLGDAHDLITSVSKVEDRKEIRVTFGDQLRAFRSMYPGGFQGEVWRDAHRAPPSGRRTKRHVDAVLADAKNSLSHAALSEAPGEALEKLATLMSKTGLASPSKDVRPLREISDDKREALGLDLINLLYGEEDSSRRLGQWVLALHRAGVTPTWALASVPGALADPAGRGFVKPRALTTQGRTLGTANAILTPSAASWRSANTTMQAVHERLVAEGFAPVDRIDVAHFVHETLRPKTIKAIEEGEL